MRYPPEHKQAMRTRLVEAGAALAKQDGFGNTGMDALTAAAGVTTGAFYSQFRSKPEFLKAIVEHELAKTLAAFEGKSPQELMLALSWYLSPRHAKHPESGCPVPALGAEIGRADADTKAQFEAMMLKIQAAVRTAVDNDAAAWAILCQAVGGVVIARAMATPERRDEVLKSVLDNALGLLHPAP